MTECIQHGGPIGGPYCGPDCEELTCQWDEEMRAMARNLTFGARFGMDPR